MTKKEQSQLDDLREQVEIAKEQTRVAKALSWTRAGSPDVPAPENGTTMGYLYNVHTSRIAPASSGIVSHNYGNQDFNTGSRAQGSRALYSTKLRALQALRHEVEKDCAARLAAIDAQIEVELTSPAPPAAREAGHTGS